MSPHLPFFVMIISVPTELNCFHKEEFSSSILMSSFGALAAGSLGIGAGASSRGGKALAGTSQALGYSGRWAGACRSVGARKRRMKMLENKTNKNTCSAKYLANIHTN